MKDELREAAEIAGTRAFPAHPHFRGMGADLYIAGYEAGKQELAAELKELREFVGAIKTCRVEANDDEFEGFWQDDTFKFAYGTFKNHIVATGTDPFDAWRKMNAGEGE